MTATAASTPRNDLRALAHTMRMANVITDVAVTLGGLGVTPAGLDINTYGAQDGATFAVDVCLTGRAAHTVDLIVDEIAGTWGRDDGLGGNYMRTGMVTFGGEPVRIRVYTGRPTGGAL